MHIDKDSHSGTARVALGLLCTGALLGVGCAGSLRGLEVDLIQTPPRCVECPTGGCGGGLEIQFLGAGGFVIARGEDVILTGPFFSNPSFLRTGLLRIESDEAAVLRWMPNVPDAKAILVAHSHYDHLMDIPTVSREKASQALVYLNDSGAHVLAAVEPGLETLALDSYAWSQGHPQRWISVPDTNVRFLPIRSDHAPHFMGFRLYDGAYQVDQGRLPKRATGWKLGQPLAFLIEFLAEDDSVDVRIHYQDSASAPRAGFPPRNLAPARYKILIPTVASWDKVSDYPEKIIEEFEPDFAVLGHWEDFFLPYSDDVTELRTARLTNPRPFVATVREKLGDAFALPARLAKIQFKDSCP